MPCAVFAATLRLICRYAIRGYIYYAAYAAAAVFLTLHYATPACSMPIRHTDADADADCHDCHAAAAAALIRRAEEIQRMLWRALWQARRESA